MSMRHVSLHDTIDTPSHTPAHTRLLEHTPPYNSLGGHGWYQERHGSGGGGGGGGDLAYREFG